MKGNAPLSTMIRGGGLFLLMLLSCNSGPESHTVTFSLDGGYFPEGYETTITVTDGNTLDGIPEPKKDSTYSYRYTFEGWYTDESFTDEYEYDTALPVTGDLTLYAKWNRYAISHTKRYTISFQTGGGTAVASQSVASGSLAVVPDEPEMEGYIFDGWYSDANTLMLYDFEAPVTSSITLYAKWAEACDVTFSNQMPDDIKHLVTIPDKVYVKKSDTMAFPAITIEGNTLSNIKLSYENGAEFDPNAPISEDLTLKVTIDSYAIAGDTYYVLTEAGLNEWATATARGISYDCVLLEDITLTNKDAGNWKSIGSYGSPYDGTFDGNGHRIGSLNIKEAMSPSNWEGLGFFGYLDGTVRDLHVDGVIEITDNTGNKMSYSVGGIAGTVEDSAAIIGCSSEIKISMKAETVCAGGTAGENEGSIIDCYYIGNGTSSSFEKDGSYAHIGDDYWRSSLCRFRRHNRN